MQDRYTIVEGELALTDADTEYTLALPKDAREFLARLDDVAVAFRFSATTGRVATGGYPLAAGQSIGFGVGMSAQTLYFASASASKVLHYSYLTPTRSIP